MNDGLISHCFGFRFLCWPMTAHGSCMKLKLWFLLHILAATRGLRHLGAGQCPHSEEYRDFHLLYLSTVTTNVPPCLCHHALASTKDTDPRHYGPQAGQSRASRQQDDDYLSFCTIYVFSAISVLICCCHLALLALSLTLRLRPKYIQGFACRLAYTHKLYVSMFLHIQGQLFNDPLLQPSYDWKPMLELGKLQTQDHQRLVPQVCLFLSG